MKEFKSKTIEEAVALAASELGVPAEKLAYRVVEEKKGLFRKEVTISVYEDSDAVNYAQEYLKTAIGGLGVEIETNAVLEDEIIKITINSERNPILIGKNGHTLQALNELTRLAVSNKFHHRFRVLIDVGGYKEDKYQRVTYVARRNANDVLRSHIDCQLDPMTPDERRIVHNALSGMEHIKTESVGVDPNRAIVIKYVD